MGVCLSLNNRAQQEAQDERAQNGGQVANMPAPAVALQQDINEPLGFTESALRRRMTARLWTSLDDGGNAIIQTEEHVEDRVAALRLQEFLKKHKNDMELGLLARANETNSDYDDRIHRLFDKTTAAGQPIHRFDQTRLHWLKSWVTTPFLLTFLETNWSHVNFSPFMTLEDVENRLQVERTAIVVRLSSTIPGFITVSCNAKQNNQPIHVRYQVRHDLSIRGEQDISYNDFDAFIANFDQQEGAPSERVAEGPAHEISEIESIEPVKVALAENESHPKPNIENDPDAQDPIHKIGPAAPHVALYARTSDIQHWDANGEGEGESTVALLPS